MGGYDAVDDAAAAALMRINAQPDVGRKEYIGLIYQDPKSGKFKFTDPQTMGARGETKGAFRIPRGSLRAVIHSHTGNDKQARLLSQDDVVQAKKYDVPSYIGVGNSLLRWTGKLSRDGRNIMGKTEEVLAQIPIQEIKQAFDAAMAARKDPSIGNMFTGKK